MLKGVSRAVDGFAAQKIFSVKFHGVHWFKEMGRILRIDVLLRGDTGLVARFSGDGIGEGA